MRVLLLLVLTILSGECFSQDITGKISMAYENLLTDSQLSHGIVSLYVVDSKTGKVLFDKNGQLGLAAASTQKVIIGSSAYAMLGHDYTYKTTLSYNGTTIKIKGSGDPTFGSWRYNSTREDSILSKMKIAIVREGITNINENIQVENSLWKSELVLRGWTWEDMGSYYGAGASGFNWRENQYDLIMRSGKKTGEPVTYLGTNPSGSLERPVKMDVQTGTPGSGDQAYIFLPSYDSFYHVRGTIPPNEEHFAISGALIHPDRLFINSLKNVLPSSLITNHRTVNRSANSDKMLFTHLSPPLDSIEYWFLKKSINLYGEALLKTIAFEKTHYADADTGIKIIKDFWITKGIDPASLNIKDGSGLSPANRITAHALVTVLQYDIKQPWFNSFFEALPVINGLKMKSGSISDVLAYAGFSKDNGGNKYTFAIIVNNYNGSSNSMRQKMWKLLDNLK